MQDIFERTIDYLRISITDRCNFRCIYCMPEEGIHFLDHKEVLTFDEIIRICQAGVKLGIKKLKITGGEPLVRRDALTLMRRLKEIEGIEEVTLTTNGYLLKRYIDELVEIGIDGVNISLDARDPALFSKITRGFDVNKVIDAIAGCVAVGIKTKVNTLIMPGINEDQILPMTELAKDLPIHVRFIEVMPIGQGKKTASLTPEQVRERIETVYGTLMPSGARLGNGPAKYYTIDGFQGKIGFISAVSDCFCESCNRVRLTSTGFLKACLQYSYGVDLKPILRGQEDEGLLVEAMRTIMFRKPKEHQFNGKIVARDKIKPVAITKYNEKYAKKIEPLISDEDEKEVHNMSSIGG